MDPDLPLYDIRTMEQRVDESLAGRKFSMLLLTIFAALASGLAALGIYGVVAFLVAQGTKEMGIRMALGATPRGIGLLVVRHGLVIAVAGIGLGVAGAFAMTRVMQSLLFGVTATDPFTYAAGVGPGRRDGAGGVLCPRPPGREARSDALAAMIPAGALL